MNENTTTLPPKWAIKRIEETFAPLEDGRTLHQGWSPQCEKEPSPSEDVWGVLKTTSIQAGEFQPEHNKRLPASLEPRPQIEVKEGDLLLTCAGPRVRCGVACLVRQTRKRLMMSGKMYRFRVDPKQHDARYVEAFLQTEQARLAIDKMKTGSSDSGLNLTHERFRQLLVPVPATVNDQRRIVAEIEKQFTRLEAGVAALRRVQANLRRYRAAVLKAACEGRLDPTKTAWPQKQIATAIQTMDQGWSPKCESEASDNDAIWAVIKTTAIQNLRFIEIENKKLPASLKPRPHLELQSGDLLVTRAGPRNRVGVACLVKSTRPRLMLCDKAYRLRCKLNVADPAFLELVLNAPHIVDEVNKLKTGISDSGVNLTQKRFGELLIPLPPLAEQTRIVAEVERRLSVVAELESVVSANLQRASRLRQSILQKAFTGELV